MSFLHVCLCYPLTSNNIPLGSGTLNSSLTVQYARQLRNIWRYQRGKHKPPIKEWQITQWPKEVGQEDKQYYTKYYTDNQRSSNTKPIKTGVILNSKTFLLHMWYSLYYSCYNENVDIKNLIHMMSFWNNEPNPVKSHKWGKDSIMIATNGTYPW